MKRRLSKLALFLLLGAIVNVAVAWGCAAFLNLMANESSLLTWTLSENEGWYLRQWKKPGGVFYNSLRTTVLTTSNSPPPRGPHPADVVPKQGELHIRHTEYAREDSWIETRGVSFRGWPMLSMWCEYPELGRAYIVEISGGIELPLTEGGFAEYYPGFRSTWQKALPLRILWQGFALNTLFYAALLWIPFAPFQLRRYIRFRRGMCIKCGYDLRGTSRGTSGGKVCPECGTLTSKAILRSLAR